MSRQTMMTPQAQLNRLGYDAGTPDGIFGSGTRRLATTREENFFGKFAGAEPGTEARFDDLVTQNLRENGDGSLNVYHSESLASGLARVWARENTREALWDAMARKQVYATIGTRMLVRVTSNSTKSIVLTSPCKAISPASRWAVT